MQKFSSSKDLSYTIWYLEQLWLQQRHNLFTWLNKIFSLIDIYCSLQNAGRVGRDSPDPLQKVSRISSYTCNSTTNRPFLHNNNLILTHCHSQPILWITKFQLLGKFFPYCTVVVIPMYHWFYLKLTWILSPAIFIRAINMLILIVGLI